MKQTWQTVKCRQRPEIRAQLIGFWNRAKPAPAGSRLQRVPWPYWSLPVLPVVKFWSEFHWFILWFQVSGAFTLSRFLRFSGYILYSFQNICIGFLWTPCFLLLLKDMAISCTSPPWGFSPGRPPQRILLQLGDEPWLVTSVIMSVNLHDWPESRNWTRFEVH